MALPWKYKRQFESVTILTYCLSRVESISLQELIDTILNSLLESFSCASCISAKVKCNMLPKKQSVLL